VRKHNTTFVEFITDVAGETVEVFNGAARLVRYPAVGSTLLSTKRFTICAANATCSAFKASGVDAEAAMLQAKAELEKIGYMNEARRLQYLDSAMCAGGSWDMDFINSSPVTGISDAIILSYSGYSGTRHVVFFLHGLTGDRDDLAESYCKFWNYYPGNPAGPPVSEAASSCTFMNVAGFEHLVMVFPSSTIVDPAHGSSWGDDVDDATTFDDGIDNLESMMCGGSSYFTSGVCSGTGYLATNYGVDSSSEVMMIGFSNGGACSMYANMMYGAVVTKAVAIDFHAYTDYNAWIASAGTMPGLATKIYYACGSYWYGFMYVLLGDMFCGFPVSNNCPSSIIAQAGLDAAESYTTATYGPLGAWYVGETYKEWTWTESSGKYITLAVEGLSDGSTTDFDSIDFGMCTSWVCTREWGSQYPDKCTPHTVHSVIEWWTDPIGDITEWITAPPPPPPSPPVISPSPPPSPPPPSPAPSPPPTKPWYYDFCMVWKKDPYMALRMFPVHFWRKYPPCVEEMFCGMLGECRFSKDSGGCYYEVVSYAKRMGINYDSIYCFAIFYYTKVSKGEKSERMPAPKAVVKK
jgi:predicted esterase